MLKHKRRQCRVPRKGPYQSCGSYGISSYLQTPLIKVLDHMVVPCTFKLFVSKLWTHMKFRCNFEVLIPSKSCGYKCSVLAFLSVQYALYLLHIGNFIYIAQTI